MMYTCQVYNFRRVAVVDTTLLSCLPIVESPALWIFVQAISHVWIGFKERNADDRSDFPS